MQDLIALFDFATKGIWVASEALGQKWSMMRQDHRVEIELPPFAWPHMAHPEDVEYEPDPLNHPFLRLEAEAHKASGRNPPSHPCHTVDYLRIAVHANADVPFVFEGVEHIGREDRRDSVPEVERVLDEVQPIAAKVAEDFLQWVRVGYRQSWLPPGVVGVPDLAYRAVIRSEGVRVDAIVSEAGWGSQPTPTLYLTVPQSRDPTLVLTPTGVAEIVRAVEGAQQPDIAETLLRDAEYFIFHADPPHGQHAVLLAAIACEVMAKTTLQNRAGAAAGLAELLLGESSAATVRTDNLVTKVSHALVGRSLREEDPELNKKFSRLIEVRNRIAHRGETPDLEEARELVGAAQRVFDWLGTL